jgi:DNA ligase-1
MANSFLMLANSFKPGKHSLGGAFVSEKLDGTRAFWDGGVSRGVATTQVPWAGVLDPKTGEPKKKVLPTATGLWSRYGNPIMAPDWFLNQLPACPLDGELWAGRGNFQELRSIVARDEPDERWKGVHFVVFGSPSPANVYAQRDIKIPQQQTTIDPLKVMDFIQSRLESGVLEGYKALTSCASFEDEIAFLRGWMEQDPNIYLHHQWVLPDNEQEAVSSLNNFMDEVLQRGGEGIIIRQKNSIWLPKRVNTLLKLKPYHDDQAEITGFTSGRETTKGSKLRGLIGALITKYKGQRLELSGLTDEKRRFKTEFMEKHAYDNPGTDMPGHFEAKHFKVGDTVEFRYRELSDEGIPKEARFLRKL